MNGMHFNDLLKANGYDPNQVFLIKHVKGNDKARICREHGLKQLLNFTRIQTDSGFGGRNRDYWAVFDEEGTNGARLLWFFKRHGSEPLTEKNLPEGYPAEWTPDKDYLYDLEKLYDFKELQGRLVIEWQSGGRQGWKHSAEEDPERIGHILRIDEGEEFPGFDDLMLSYDRLKSIVDEEWLYSGWKKAMSGVAAIYVITCTGEDGGIYIGSATAEEGLWSRWKGYAHTKTNGNKLLDELLAKHPEAYRSFRFSVLQILDPRLKRDAILHMEANFKNKLGTYATALKENEYETGWGKNAN